MKGTAIMLQSTRPTSELNLKAVNRATRALGADIYL